MYFTCSVARPASRRELALYLILILIMNSTAQTFNQYTQV